MKKISYIILVLILMMCSGCNNEAENTTELENYGEGTSSLDLPVLENEEMVEADNTITVQTESLDYEIVIEDIVFTEKRNEYEAEYDQVVLVTYTYKNHMDQMLLIDDVRFQLISSDETELYTPYYLSDLLYAEPIGKGQTATAQIAFGVSDGETNFKLVYKDTSGIEMTPWVMDVVLQKY